MSVTSYKEYYCTVCELECPDKTKYHRHINTTKHINKVNNIVPEPRRYSCLCGNTYKYHQGLSVHKKTCQGGSVKLTENAPDLTQMVIELVKSNAILVEAQRQSQAQAMEANANLPIRVLQRHEIEGTLACSRGTPTGIRGLHTRDLTKRGIFCRRRQERAYPPVGSSPLARMT